MSDNLNSKHQLFVAEYLKDRNGPAAAQRAGFSARSASRLLATPAIAQAIAALTDTETSTEGASTSRDGLIRELDDAYRIARESNNAAAMVSAATAKARLLGLAAPEPAPDDLNPVKRDEPLPARQIARAILGILRQATIDGETPSVAIAAPGETILRVRDPDLAPMIGAEPAPLYSPDTESRVAIGDKGFAIELCFRSPEGRDKWEIVDAAGVSHGAVWGRETAERACRELIEHGNITRG